MPTRSSKSYNVITPEGGFSVWLKNETGAPTAKGSLVSASLVNFSFKLQTNEFDTIGIIYDHGVAIGDMCRVVVSGIAEVLLEDATASTAGNWVVAGVTDGRANATEPTPFPNNTIGEHTLHFKEVGHCIETKSAGVNVLAKCIIHFN